MKISKTSFQQSMQIKSYRQVKSFTLAMAIILITPSVMGTQSEKAESKQGEWKYEKPLIIPAPQEIIAGKSFLPLKKELRVFFSKKLATENAFLIKYMRSELNRKISTVKQRSQADIILEYNNEQKKSEGYKLVVGEKTIQIDAPSSAGIFYGIQTLRQMMNNKESIPQLTINDTPAYPIRSFMLDEARHFKGKEVVKQLLNNMARMKMNTFHWHLTDDQGWRIEIKKYPKLTKVGAFRDSTEIERFHSNIYDGKPHGGFYTQADIREIVSYAKQRHIQIIPEIEIPGHASAAIASYPWLGLENKQISVPCNFGVHNHNVYNVANPNVFKFFSDVMDEIIPLFPGDIIHIGGDEVRYDEWKSSEAIKALMREKGIKSYPELQVWTTNTVAHMLKGKGRRMMGWNEITGDQINDYQTEKVGQFDFQLEKESVVQFWKGDKELIKKIAKKGYDIINSTHDYTYLDYSYSSIPLEKAYNFNPIPEGLSPEYQKQIKGISCQMWGEFIPTVDKMNQMVYPRIAAYAEVGWTRTENKNWANFKQALQALKKEWRKAGILYHEDSKD